MSAALRAPALSDAVSRSALAPVTSTHWLMSRVVVGAASVVSLDEELDVADAEVEFFVVDPEESSFCCRTNNPRSLVPRSASPRVTTVGPCEPPM